MDRNCFGDAAFDAASKKLHASILTVSGLLGSSAEKEYAQAYFALAKADRVLRLRRKYSQF